MTNKSIFRFDHRSVIEISGSDSLIFLQNLVTNDVNVSDECLIYSGLLTPQGKYLFDFFLLKKARDRFLIDIDRNVSESFFRRLLAYRLRSDIKIEKTNYGVFVGFGNKPMNARTDPRSDKMGWRLFDFESPKDFDCLDYDKVFFDRRRINHCIPETGIELQPEKTFILEAGFERLSGVSFTKGCYVGQEVTAKMKHRVQPKRGLVSVELTLPVDNNSEEQILSGEKVVGRLFTRVKNFAIASINYKFQNMELVCGKAKIKGIKQH